MNKKAKKKSKAKTMTFMKRRERGEVLNGSTYIIENVPNGLGELITINLIINDDAIGPFEVFTDCNDAHLYEWLSSITRLASVMMQYNLPPAAIADSIIDIHSPNTFHTIPNTNGKQAKSLPSRIGYEIYRHYMKN